MNWINEIDQHMKRAISEVLPLMAVPAANRIFNVHWLLTRRHK